MLKKNIKLFEKDFKQLTDHFPKLYDYSINQTNNAWLISGEIDICDVEGNYWDTFKIKIQVPFSYPHCVLRVQEINEKIERVEHRHVDELGICCLDIEHKLLVMKTRGINLISFMKDKIYPFFANQLYYEKEGKFANGEFLHRFEGIRQFYFEDLKVDSTKEAILLLEFILSKEKLGRNDSCFCRKGKYKDCHLDIVEFLKSVGKNQLEIDLRLFKEGFDD